MDSPDVAGVKPASAGPSELAPEAFERRALESPERVALSAGGARVTYGELHERARRVAGALASRGLGPGDVVAVSGRKRVGLVVALLGVLGSGAAILPLDPALPARRRRQMALAGGARLELSVDGEDGAGLPAVPVSDAGGIEGGGASAPSFSGRDEGPAYVVFTSGTTGEPAGVEGSHAGLGLFLRWQRETFGVGPGDRVPFLTGLSFDVMLRDLLLPLTSGATLCLPPDGLVSSPPALRAWLASERITLLHAVPSLAATWLSAEPAPAAPLRWTFFAGEPLAGALVTRWRAAFPSTRVVNLYGPTETTLARYWHEVGDEPAPGPQRVGLPIPHTATLVVGADGAPVPRGEVGEVVIRTPYRALRVFGGRGFVPDPTGGPELVYPTGDRGRLLEDGTLELLGRLDDQVKVNGVRVDPGEVAAHLLAHPDVREAAVVPRDGRLVAYVVARDRSLPLRTFLASRLPAAMVPDRVVFVDGLPLTERGKLDRDRLPETPPADSCGPGAPSEPLNEAEGIAAGIWAEVLGRAPARGESFLELGGTSLDVLSFLARLEERHGLALEPSDLFEAPTVEALGRRIGSAVRASPFPPAPAAASRVDEVPLTPAQRRLWLDQELRRNAPAYRLSWALDLRGPLREPAFRESLDRVVARHPALRMRFETRDGLPSPRVLPPSPVGLGLVDLSHLLDAGERDRALREAAAGLARVPLDLERGPLFRARLARLASERHVALFTAHHLVLDGWSRWLLIRELLERYAGARPVESDPATDAAYLAEAGRLASTSASAEGLAHFVSRLRGARALSLPVDGPRPEGLDPGDPDGERVRTELPPRVRAALERFARDRGATPYMVLLAAFQALLGRFCGQDDIVVGSPVAGRTSPASEGLLGCFINLVALRADLSGAPSFETLVARARRETLAALAHASTPFEAVVEALRPPRRPGRAPLVDVLFNVVNVPQAPPSLPDLEVSYPDDLFPASSPFAMTLYVRERSDRLDLTLLYRTALFSRRRMEGLLAEYVELLTTALESPRRPLDAARAAPPGSERSSSSIGSDGPGASGAASLRPDGQVERAVAALWREVLVVSDVASEEGFFELGGDSLGAVRLVLLLRERLGVDLPLGALLESQTLGELAARVEAVSRRARPAPVPRAATLAPKAAAPLPLSVAQARLFQRLEAEGLMRSSAAFNVPRAVSLTGPLDVGRLGRALEAVAARHGALRARFASGPSQVVEPAIELPLTLLDVSASDLPAILEEEGARPFALDTAPLFRARLLRLPREPLQASAVAESHVLLLTAHHLVADCWSMGIPFPGSSGRWMPGLLVEELAGRYASDANEAPPIWGPQERVESEATWLAGEEARAQRSFWERSLANAPRLSLARGRPRPPAGCYAGVRYPFGLSLETSEALRRLARASSATLFETLLTVFGGWLHEATGATDIVVGTPVSGRAREELAPMIGFLGNHVAIRIHVDPRRPFRDRLVTASAACRSAFAHQGYPIELLGDESPFDVRLVLHRADRPPIPAGDIVLSPHPSPREIAKHDLTLLLADAGEGPLEGWLETPAGLFPAVELAEIASGLAGRAREAAEA